MPPIVARNIFRLKLSDFVIDPFKVQTSDIKEGIYRAKVAFSGREVLLQILPSSYPQGEGFSFDHHISNLFSLFSYFAHSNNHEEDEINLKDHPIYSNQRSV